MRSRSHRTFTVHRQGLSEGFPETDPAPHHRHTHVQTVHSCRAPRGSRGSSKVVAVKVVPLEDDSGEAAREIERLRECDQPNIVQYVGSFVHEERLWIMMEYCEGSSLLDIMAATGRCLTEVCHNSGVHKTYFLLFRFKDGCSV